MSNAFHFVDNGIWRLKISLVGIRLINIIVLLVALGCLFNISSGKIPYCKLVVFTRTDIIENYSSPVQASKQTKRKRWLTSHIN